MPRKTSIVHDREKVAAAIAKSDSIRAVLLHLGLRAAGGNHNVLKKACQEMGLELPRYKPSIVNLRKANYIPNEQVFVENSSYSNRSGIKKRLYAMGIPEKCNKCGVGNSWQGKPLSLTLEHINGIWNDNRLENLEILCPNCHSQTSTYAGRGGHSRENSISFRPEPSLRVLANNCVDCQASIGGNSTRCQSCSNIKRYNKNYPDIETLIELVTDGGFGRTSRMIGVADTALRKHMKKVLPADHPVFALRSRGKAVVG